MQESFTRNDDTEVFHHKSHTVYKWNWQGVCIPAIWPVA